MPIYSYRCTKCDHRFEELQMLTDKPLSKCPECKSKLEKVPTTFKLGSSQKTKTTDNYKRKWTDAASKWKAKNKKR
jgi:putative FmdB family regulatory protein